MPDPDGRRADLIATIGLSKNAGEPDHTITTLNRLCTVTRALLEAGDVGVTVISPGAGSGVVASVTGFSVRMHELQFTLGQGPSLDTMQSGRPLLIEDLHDRAWDAWPAFLVAAARDDVGAILTLPIQIGASPMGVLDVYYPAPVRLDLARLKDAFTLADIAAELILDGQGAAPPGAAADGVADALDYRDQLFHAQGMVTVQLGVDLTQAMAHIRAYATAQGMPLTEVAQAIVDRRLELTKEQD